jgi:hypothetical protein
MQGDGAGKNIQRASVNAGIRFGRLTSALAVALYLAACAMPFTQQPPAPVSPAAVQPAAPPPAAPAPPPPVPATPPPPDPTVVAQRELEEAVAIYDKGDFNAAIERLGSPAIAAGDTPIRVAAHKYSAFSYCVTRRTSLCRTQFEAALKLDPAFELSPAERGHPLWGPVFERVKKAQSAPAKK